MSTATRTCIMYQVTEHELEELRSRVARLTKLVTNTLRDPTFKEDEQDQTVFRATQHLEIVGNILKNVTDRTEEKSSSFLDLDSLKIEDTDRFKHLLVDHVK